MSSIYIGTSGYDYPEWKNIFYPPDMKRCSFLEFYASQFNALELNFSYYAMPSGTQLSHMVKRSGGKVHFSIKGCRQFTHEIHSPLWKQAVQEFRQALYPFTNNGLLLTVLLQFPQSFHYEKNNRIYLAQLLDEFGDTPCTVEFRHKDWYTQRVSDELQRRGIGLCVCDMPDISVLPRRLTSFPENKTSIYMRFHGRNNTQWYTSENSRDRYDYLYSASELEQYAPFLRGAVENTRIVQIYFNNHAKGAAAVNAQKMKVLMSS